MRTVKLKPGRAKALWMGHPWVYADSIAKVDPTGTDQPDDWVRVVDADGKMVGCGFYSERSVIRVRIVSRGTEEAVAGDLLAQRLRGACELRDRLFPDSSDTDAYRLVHGEGDGLPGLVVDRLKDVLVAQFATAPIHARRQEISRVLLEASDATTLVARKAGYEEREGIEEDETPFVVGATPADRVVVREAGLRLETAPLAGQKTGHYADQRENRKLVGELASGLSVLDLYAGTGGFSLQAALHGARSCRAVDASQLAVDMAQANAQHNGASACVHAEQADVNDVLGALRVSKEQFGLVVTDPPNFFPRKGSERHAIKAYRELNVRSLSRVAPGGFLATFSCSARMEPVRFLELLRSASRECRREFSILRELSAGPDHPVARALPEGRYLTGLLLRVDG